ncbi:CBS domain-containing protein [Pedobacter psychrodurus]|uniref:CBS domain-containing protein n=1 Tax=Pedobacter psychrodurus TaxID=2530456 RepID=UPI00292E56D8|nr:CBS domain-containing protein [Pedobacter psychrodurus]
MTQLEIFFQEIKESKKIKKTTPKVICKKYGVVKRGWKVIEAINKLLEKYELTSNPDFENAYYYGEIEIAPKSRPPKLAASGEVKRPKYADAIPRLSLLRAANINNLVEEEGCCGLISVKKETTLTEATTIMLRYNFSQLPILSGNRDVVGLISWKSIGTALSLGKNCETVFDCKEDVEVLSIDEPIFKAMNVILAKEVILVRDKKNTISGIVTATDLGEQFLKLSEPFLIIEQIENLVRRLLDGKLTFDDIKKVLDLSKHDKEIHSLADLNFGHYVRIMENPELYAKLGLRIDRVILQKMLQETRIIRNDVMHFKPEEIEQKDLDALRQVLNFLTTIINTI